MRSTLLSVLLGLALVQGAQAQDDPTRRGGAPSYGAATRSVSRYLNQERALEEAVSSHDRAAVVRWLADDFEIQSATTPDPINLDTWLTGEFAVTRLEGVVRDLAVREYGDMAVVSFLVDREAAKGRARATEFVVDLWRQADRKLMVRFVGGTLNTAPAPRRPSGRE